MGRKEVFDRIEETHKQESIQLLGDKKNKVDGFYILMNTQAFVSTYILMNTQAFVSTKKETFHGIKPSTLKLLDEAEIKYRIINLI